MDEVAATSVLFQDANLYSLLQTGALDRGADLTPALLQGPALLSRFVDPNAGERRLTLAKGLVSRKEDRLGLKRARQVSELRQVAALAPVTAELAALKLDTSSGAPPMLNLALNSRGERFAKKPHPRHPTMSSTGGVLNLNARSTLKERKDFPTAEQKRIRGVGSSDDMRNEGGGGRGNEDQEAFAVLDDGRPVFELLRESQSPLASPSAAAAAAPGKLSSSAPLDPEMAQLDTDIGRVRAYLDLLAQYSQSHFLVYQGRTLTTTPDFLSFQRRHAAQWPAVSGAISQLETLLVRHAVPLAVVEGEQLASAACGCVGASVSVPVLLACLENLEQVEPLLQLPGKQAPVGDTKRAVRKNGAVRIQSLVRRFLERGRFLGRLEMEHAAGLLQRQTRGRLVWSRTMGLLDAVRATNKAVGLGLQVRLAEQFRRAGGRPPAGRVEVHLPSMSVDEALRLRLGAAQEEEAASEAMAAASSSATTGHGVGSSGAPAGSWGRFPACQTHDALQRLSGLRDPGLRHLVFVSASELPEDVLQHWAGLVELASGCPKGSVRQRFTVVVPEMAAHFAAHYPLASQLRHSPLALRRIQRLVGRHALVDAASAAVKLLPPIRQTKPKPPRQRETRPFSDSAATAAEEEDVLPQYSVGDPAAAAGGAEHAAFTTRGARAYVVPSCSSGLDAVVAMALGLPVLAAHHQDAVRLRSRAGGKDAFTKAGINVAIGAHAVRSQEDLAIALAKLVAVHLDVEEWSLRANSDLGAVGVAYLKASDLGSVNALREQRHQQVKAAKDQGHQDPNHAWLHPDVQLLVRATLLKDLRAVLPLKVRFAAPHLYPGGWHDYLKHFLRGGGCVEAEPPVAALVGRVGVNMFLGPHACPQPHLLAGGGKTSRNKTTNPALPPSDNIGGSSSGVQGRITEEAPSSASPLLLPAGAVVIESAQELLVTPHRLPLACAFPQRCLPPLALEQCALSLAKELLAQGVCGHVTASFTVFRDKKSLGGKLRLWGESIEPWLTPAAAAHACCSLAVATPARVHPSSTRRPLAAGSGKGDSGGGKEGGAAMGGGDDDDPFVPSKQALANAAAAAVREAIAKAEADAAAAVVEAAEKKAKQEQGGDEEEDAPANTSGANTPVGNKSGACAGGEAPAAGAGAGDGGGVAVCPDNSPGAVVRTQEEEEGPVATAFSVFAAAEAAEGAGPPQTAAQTSPSPSPLPPRPRPWLTTAAAAAAGQAATATPKGVAYVATVGGLRHPGLASFHPMPFLLRSLRLQGHGFDVRSKQGDVVWPIDSLCGGVVAVASVSRGGNEEAAAKAFLRLLKNYFHKHVGTRTVAGAQRAKEAGAWQPVMAQRESRGVVDPDGLGDFVALTELVEATALRFHLRRNPPKVVEEPKFVSRFGSSSPASLGANNPGSLSSAGSNSRMSPSGSRAANRRGGRRN